MIENNQKKFGPLVTVLLPTFNRPRYLPEALNSIVRQDYANLQIIVINDGGADVGDIVRSFNDSRIIYLNRKDNRGKAYSLNQALTANAEGKYIAYLDDDDMFYPNHIAKLVDKLESGTDCQAAYTDLYKAYYRPDCDGERTVLSKVVEISRDFDRFFMFYFNHVLHVSVMHKMDLIEKTGLYNESLNILIDWDMTRKLTFFTDFCHVNEVSGEYYSSIGETDRISVVRRRNVQDYTRNVLAIRTTRPQKPWPKVKDLSIIFTCDFFDQATGSTLGKIWKHVFYPYQVYIPFLKEDRSRFKTEMPNLVYVPIERYFTQSNKFDAALNMCEGEYVAIIPSGLELKDASIENPLYAMMNSSNKMEAFELEEAGNNQFAAVVRKEELLFARKAYPNLSVGDSMMACGFTIRKPNYEEYPFIIDDLYKDAQQCEKDGNWMQAAQIYDYIGEKFQNTIWMKSLAAKAYYKAGCISTAAGMAGELNKIRPTIDTMFLEAKVHRQKKNFDNAIELLNKSKLILEGQRRQWI